MGGGHKGCCRGTLGVSQPLGRESPPQCKAYACGALIPTAGWGPGMEWGMSDMSLISSGLSPALQHMSSPAR